MACARDADVLARECAKLGIGLRGRVEQRELHAVEDEGEPLPLDAALRRQGRPVVARRRTLARPAGAQAAYHGETVCRRTPTARTRSSPAIAGLLREWPPILLFS
jgi:hypothetical protein